MYRDGKSIFNEIDDVKRRDINKTLKDENYKVSSEINLNLMKRFYKDTMKKNNGSFDEIALNLRKVF